FDPDAAEEEPAAPRTVPGLNGPVGRSCPRAGTPRGRRHRLSQNSVWCSSRLVGPVSPLPGTAFPENLVSRLSKFAARRGPRLYASLTGVVRFSPMSTTILVTGEAKAPSGNPITTQFGIFYIA